MLFEASAIHGEGLLDADTVGRLEVEEPAEQGVVADLLHELRLAANVVERPQQEGLDEPFRWDARRTVLGVGPVEVTRHGLRDFVGALLDGP